MNDIDIEQLFPTASNILKPNNLQEYSDVETLLEEYWEDKKWKLQVFVVQDLKVNQDEANNLLNSYKWFYFIDYACQTLLEANYQNPNNNYSVNDIIQFLEDEECDRILKDTSSSNSHIHFGKNSNWRKLSLKQRFELTMSIKGS